MVIFTWTSAATDEQKASAVAALETWKSTAMEFGTVQVGVDARLAGGNGDVGVVADFRSVEDYQSYAQDSRHQQLIRDHIKPILAERTAVQYEI